jgi:hypothetical protein
MDKIIQLVLRFQEYQPSYLTDSLFYIFTHLALKLDLPWMNRTNDNIQL